MPDGTPDGTPDGRPDAGLGRGRDNGIGPAVGDVTGMLAHDAFDAELARWAAAARADHAAASRARERWLRQVATEEASMVGVLADLAERSLAVVVQTGARRSHRGVVVAVGADFCVLRTGAGPDVLVALSALTSVRAAGRSGAPVGDRALPTGLGFAEMLVAMAGERPRVHLVTTAGDSMRGDVRSVGRDVLTLALEGDDRPVVYVPLGAVAEVALA